MSLLSIAKSSLTQGLERKLNWNHCLKQLSYRASGSSSILTLCNTCTIKDFFQLPEGSVYERGIGKQGWSKKTTNPIYSRSSFSDGLNFDFTNRIPFILHIFFPRRPAWSIIKAQTTICQVRIWEPESPECNCLMNRRRQLSRKLPIKVYVV